MLAPELLEIGSLTVRVAAAATALNAIPAVALGYLFARRRFPGRAALHALVDLPLLLPPVAIGVLLLETLSPRGPLRALTAQVELLFTARAAVLAAMVMSLPLAVRAAEEAFAQVPRRLTLVARTLGAGRLRAWFSVALPLARRGIVSGLLLSFARALGEFGASVVVAGDLPHRTETLSLAIFARIQEGRDADALSLCAVSLTLGLTAALLAERLRGGGSAWVEEVR